MDEEKNNSFMEAWDGFIHAPKGTPLYIVKEIVSYIIIVLVAFVIAILLNIYIFRISTVNGESMCQTLQHNDKVFMSRLPYIFGEAKRGDIIIFDHTKAPRTFVTDVEDSIKSNILVVLFSGDQNAAEHKFYIKRVIGIPGDTVSIHDNAVYVNGEKLDESYVNPDEEPDYSSWEGKEWVVGEDELFVMGDNRNHSYDGRGLGTIPKNCVLGKVLTNK